MRCAGLGRRQYAGSVARYGTKRAATDGGGADLDLAPDRGLLLPAPIGRYRPPQPRRRPWGSDCRQVRHPHAIEFIRFDQEPECSTT